MSRPRQTPQLDITDYINAISDLNRTIYHTFCTDYLEQFHPSQVERFNTLWQRHLDTSIDPDKFDALLAELSQDSLFNRLPAVPERDSDASTLVEFLLQENPDMSFRLPLTVQYCVLYRLDLQATLDQVFELIYSRLAKLNCLMKQTATIASMPHWMRKHFALNEILMLKSDLDVERIRIEIKLTEAEQYPTDDAIRMLQLVRRLTTLQKNQDKWLHLVADPARYGGVTSKDALITGVELYKSSDPKLDAFVLFHDNEQLQESITTLNKHYQFAEYLLANINKLSKVKDVPAYDMALPQKEFDFFTAKMKDFAKEHSIYISQVRPEYKSNIADVLPKSTPLSDEDKSSDGKLASAILDHYGKMRSMHLGMDRDVQKLILPDSRQKICDDLQTCIADYASRLYTLKTFTVSLLSDRPIELSAQLHDEFRIIRQDAAVLMRKAICVDAESTTAFETLWKELTSTPDDQLATKKFTLQTVTQENTNRMLRQVPALYCKAYQRELHVEQRQVLIRANAAHKIAETAKAAEDKIIAEAKKIEKTIQISQRINEAGLIYNQYMTALDALEPSINAALHVVSEVDINELDEQYKNITKLYYEGMALIDTTAFAVYSGSELRSKRDPNFARDITKLKEQARDAEGHTTTFAAECDAIARYEKEILDLQERIKKLSRDDELTKTDDRFWEAMSIELLDVQGDECAEFKVLIEKNQALQRKREERELALGAAMQSSLPVTVLSGEESREFKEEKDCKCNQESKRDIPVVTVAKLKPADFVKHLMPSQQAVDQCKRATRLFRDEIAFPPTSNLGEKAKVLAARFHLYSRTRREKFAEQIENLRKRNEQLQVLKKLKPRKLSPKVWIGLAVHCAVVIIVAACLVGILSNPIGWSGGAQLLVLIGLCCFVRQTYIFAKKAYAQFKRNKLLEKNNKPEYIQALLERQDDALQKKSTCLNTHTTTKVREMLIEHSMIVGSLDNMADNPSRSSEPLPNAVEDCILLRDEMNAYKSRKAADIFYHVGKPNIFYKRTGSFAHKYMPFGRDEFEAELAHESKQATPAA